MQVIIEGAAEAGNIFMLNHFLNDDYLETAIFHSAKGGHRELTNDLIKRALLGENSKEAYIEQLNGALFGAAAGGQEELVQYYISKGANEWSYGLEGAIRSENMRLADFFIDRMNTVDAAVVTAINGNLPLFKKIIRNVSKRDIQRIKEKFYENFNFINREIYNYFNNLYFPYI